MMPTRPNLLGMTCDITRLSDGDRPGERIATTYSVIPAAGALR